MKRFLALVLIALSVTSQSDARTIFGASGMGPGLCSIFLMQSRGILNLSEQTTFQQLGIAQAENSGNGNGYFTARTATFDTRQYRINLQTFTITDVNQINTADFPDASNTLNGSFYNNNTSRWVSVGRTVCGGPSCVHVRTYANNAIDQDVVTAANVNSTTGPESTYDLSNVYIQYSTSGGQRIGRFNSGSYVLQESDDVNGGAGLQGLVMDNNFVYGVSTPSTIKRWSKNNLAVGETDFTPGFATNSIQVPAISSDGFIYVPGRSLGASPNILYRVRTSDMTITGSTSFANNQFLDQVFVDEFNDKLYVTFSTGTDQQITRVNRSGMFIEATFVGSTSTNGPTQGQSRLDVAHQMMYLTFNGGASTSKIQKVSLCNN